jgi:hypothetical protein
VLYPCDRLVHKIGGVRACVRKEWVDAILIPQDEVLSRGKRIRATVLSIDTIKRKVNLDNGLFVTFDYSVIANAAFHQYVQTGRGRIGVVESRVHVMVELGGIHGARLKLRACNRSWRCRYP